MKEVPGVIGLLVTTISAFETKLVGDPLRKRLVTVTISKSFFNFIKIFDRTSITYIVKLLSRLKL